MIFRLGLVVAVSIAAYAIKQLTFRKWSSSCSENGEYKDKDGLDEEEQNINSRTYAINRVNDSPSDIVGDDSLPEFRDPSRAPEHPLLDENKKEEAVHETKMDNNMIEVERSLKLVMELEERNAKLEAELLMYCGLKDGKFDIPELQKEVKIKNEDIDLLKITISSLQAEIKKLQEEILQSTPMKKDLEVARSKIKELQRQRQLDTNQMKQHLLLLKQQVSGLQAKEEAAVKKEAEVLKRLKAAKDLEVQIVELKRKNQELQHEKQELAIKVDATEARITTLTSMTENVIVTEEREEAHKLKLANEDLAKQVEGLQINRFGEVEELVYLRWVNACLRYELRNSQTPSGKISARDLNSSSSPSSKEKAKELMLEYAKLEFGQADTDPESNFFHPLSPENEDFDHTTSIDSSTSRNSSQHQKHNLNLNLEHLNRRKGGSSTIPSPGTMGSSHRWNYPLEGEMLRNTVDSADIATTGMMKQEIPEYPQTLTFSEVRMKVSSSESVDSVARSFQLMSKSVEKSVKEKYPAHENHYKLASEKEKQIKEEADKTRAEKFRDIPRVKERPAFLAPKLAQRKEKATALLDSNSEYSGDKNMINNLPILSKMGLAEIEKRPPRIPQAPPRPSLDIPISLYSNASGGILSAPPISNPPPFVSSPLTGGPHCAPDSPGIQPRRARISEPELVHFYQTSIKNEVKKITTTSPFSPTNASDARSSMIGEIENRSSLLLRVKTDVETQGDLYMSLAKEGRTASFSNMEDLVSFVIWLDEGLSLVDERAVFKHFDWPEGKTDALREAASKYQDMMRLGEQVSSFVDSPKLTCEFALKRMHSLLDKVEQSVYALIRTRDMMISRYEEFGIPVDWLLDSGVVGKIKLSSVQLARKYMKRIVNELDALIGPENEQNREFLLLQGVRFAFRVHQFAGGFDAESMEAFEELRSRVRTQVGENN